MIGTLDGDGFTVTWNWERAARAPGSGVGRVTVTAAAALGGAVHRSVEAVVLAADVTRLATYLEAHLAHLTNAPNTESPVFVGSDLAFQLQALAGDVRHDGDGELTVRVLVNVGAGPGGARLYAGAEGEVTVAAVRALVAQLRETAAALAC